MQKFLRTANSYKTTAAVFLTFLSLFSTVSVNAQQANKVESFANLLAMNEKTEFGVTNSFSTIRGTHSVPAFEDPTQYYNGAEYDDAPPVMLENFNGIYANGFTKLGWNTLMEYNLGDFVVERSRDGKDYSEVGKVAAFGNTNNFSSYYTFMDISSERGANFYRLKLMDKDGNYSFSRVIVINTEAREISLLLVYPNPFGKKVQAKIECEKAEKLTVRVINQSGQVVRTQYNDLRPGENIVTVNNVSELPGGTYVLEMIAASRTMRTQIMKQ